MGQKTILLFFFLVYRNRKICMPNYNRILRLLEKFDFFGTPAQLYIRGQSKLRSKMGGFLSLMISVFILYNTIHQIMSLRAFEHLTISQSTNSVTISGLLFSNSTFAYNFEPDIYYPYYVMQAAFPNGTLLNYSSLQRYLIQSFVYVDPQGVNREFELEACLYKKVDQFLLRPKEVIEQDSGSSPWRVCIKNDYLMGLFPNQTTETVYFPQMKYQVSTCKNSSANNFSCASLDEIAGIVPYVLIQTSIPKTFMNFENVLNPRTRSYDYNFYTVDLKIRKQYTLYVIPVQLYTDYGMISQDILLDSTDFNTESKNYDLMMNKNLTSDNVIFECTCQFGFLQTRIVRRNAKIYEVLGNLGGFLNLLMLVGGFLARKYNSWFFRHKILNYSFSNKQSSNSNVKRKYAFFLLKVAHILFRNKNPKDKFRFSLCHFLFPCPRKSAHYLQSLRNIVEFLDIKNIIRRMHDLDKMKSILFDKEEQTLFDSIPKPHVERRNTLKKFPNSCQERGNLTVMSNPDIQRFKEKLASKRSSILIDFEEMKKSEIEILKSRKKGEFNPFEMCVNRSEIPGVGLARTSEKSESNQESYEFHSQIEEQDYVTKPQIPKNSMISQI